MFINPAGRIVQMLGSLLRQPEEAPPPQLKITYLKAASPPKALPGLPQMDAALLVRALEDQPPPRESALPALEDQPASSSTQKLLARITSARHDVGDDRKALHIYMHCASIQAVTSFFDEGCGNYRGQAPHALHVCLLQTCHTTMRPPVFRRPACSRNQLLR